jgi:hypothetical protein
VEPARYFEAFGERLDGGPGAAGDGFEDVADGGESGFDAVVIGVNGAVHDAADAGDQAGIPGDGHDAGGGADDIDDVTFADVGADGVPMGVEGAGGDRDAGAEAKFRGPFGAEVAGDGVGPAVLAVQFVANAGEEGIDAGEEFLGGEAAEGVVPHPFVAHGADAAGGEGRVGDAAEGGGDQVAVFEGGGHPGALVRVMAEPVEEFGEAPFGGIDAATPGEGFEAGGAAVGGDFGGFAVGAVVAPEVIVADGLEVFVHGDDGGASGIESEGLDIGAGDACLGEGGEHGLGESAEVVGVGLGGVVGVFALAVDGVLGRGGGEAAAFTVDERDAHALGSEIDSCDDSHGGRKAPWGIKTTRIIAQWGVPGGGATP